MRKPRALRRGQTAIYHAMSRTVAGQFLFGDREKEAFRHRMRKLARFCQIPILNYTILSNHFHLILRVPDRVQLSDPQLLRALQDYYGARHPNTLQFEQALREPDSARCQQLRAAYLRRMGDLSVYIKELKEGYTRWFNRVHGRFGTLWAERFTSLVKPDCSWVITLLSAYVDLNGVRAGLVDDPKEYRFCGYGEALGEGGAAREGLESFLAGASWEEKLAGYRLLLFGQGSWGRDERAVCLDPEQVWAVYEAGGKWSVAELWRLKVRYFSQGVALGLREYVEEVWGSRGGQPGSKRGRGSWPLEGADWGGLMTLRKFKEPFALPKKEPHGGLVG